MWTFEPILKPTIWGGERIAAFKGVPCSRRDIGESWELSSVDGSLSVVDSGPDMGLTLPELIERYGAGLMGGRNFKKFGCRFPLLIKFIDANDDLSIQVHPNEHLALKGGHDNGKTEMWYVVDTRPGARVANGFRQPVDPSDYRRLVDSGEILDYLNFIDVRTADVLYIPAGRVHAIGRGTFVVEIQETSDVTYRIYDYHRKDSDGNERALNTDLAFEAIRFDDTDGSPIGYTHRPDIPVNLVTSPYFTTNLLDIDQEIMRDYSEWDTFVVLVATAGAALITSRYAGDETPRTIRLNAGHSVLIPASAKGVSISPEPTFTAIETYLK